ncbi:hypothetical protein BHM03_00043530, partial [Ensete ventricosum]
HTEAVLSVSFSPDGQNLASGSGDTTVRLWDLNTQTPFSQDCTIKVWETSQGKLIRELKAALARYNKMKGNAPERLVSGSDDFTMFLWEPASSKHPKARMTGHQQVNTSSFIDFVLVSGVLSTFSARHFTNQLMSLIQLVNHVYFSPDGQWLASASFDKSVKLWNGITGKFVASFRGHVGPVYQISTVFMPLLDLLFHSLWWFMIQVWDIRTQKLKQDLPGHADEVLLFQETL